MSNTVLSSPLPRIEEPHLLRRCRQRWYSPFEIPYWELACASHRVRYGSFDRTPSDYARRTGRRQAAPR